MMASRRKLASRTRPERVAILLLRRAAAAGAADDTAGEGEAPDRAFAMLAAAARRAGLTILPPDASFVAGDEMRILGWIAHRQREGGALPAVDPALDRAATLSAAALTALGGRLPFRIAVAAILPDVPAAPVAAPPVAPGSGSVRDRAARLSAARSIVPASAFREAGISRQTVSRLCADGVLVRAGYGLYRRP